MLDKRLVLSLAVIRSLRNCALFQMHAEYSFWRSGVGVQRSMACACELKPDVRGAASTDVSRRAFIELCVQYKRPHYYGKRCSQQHV